MLHSLTAYYAVPMQWAAGMSSVELCFGGRPVQYIAALRIHNNLHEHPTQSKPTSCMQVRAW